VGDGAGGDEIGAGFGVGADVIQRDTSGQLDGSASGNLANGGGGLGGRKIVEEEMARAVIEGFAEFSRRANLDFDWQIGMLASGIQRFANASGGGDVV